MQSRRWYLHHIAVIGVSSGVCIVRFVQMCFCMKFCDIVCLKWTGSFICVFLLSLLSMNYGSSWTCLIGFRHQIPFYAIYVIYPFIIQLSSQKSWWKKHLVLVHHNSLSCQFWSRIDHVVAQVGLWPKLSTPCDVIMWWTTWVSPSGAWRHKPNLGQPK